MLVRCGYDYFFPIAIHIHKNNEGKQDYPPTKYYQTYYQDAINYHCTKPMLL